MIDTVISLKDISKYYKLYNEPKDRLKEALHPFKKKYHKPFYALKNLNLDIKKGDILGVVGRNGCGKSTLLKLIAGVLKPNEGSISVKGKITALLELGAGFNPEFTGIDNIQFYAKVLGISDDEFEEKLPDIINFAELGDFLYQPVKTYSSGMKARLGFSVAVHVDPEILILDEVLAVGDALFKRKCYAKMEEFFKAGKTIIYVSHDSNSVTQLCNRAVLIHEGNIIMDSEPKEVAKYYEKLLFSKQENNASIIESIKDYKTKPDVAREALASNSQDKPVKRNHGFRPFLIDGLTPKSTVLYLEYDVDIQEPCFSTLSGEKVNCFVFGEQYKFTAKILFHCNAEDVSFGFVIKDLKGQTVSSFESKKQYDYGQFIHQVDKGSVIDIEIVFPCVFVNGDYYIDLGVSSFKGNQVILSRGVDLSMFRVINAKPYSAGAVDIISNMNVLVDGHLAIKINKDTMAY